MTFFHQQPGTAYHNDHDEEKCHWLRELMAADLIAPGVIDSRSLEDVAPTELAGFVQHHLCAGIGVWSYAARRSGWPDGQPLRTLSLPCQPFSAAGKGEAFADDRHLWPAAAWHIELSDPRPTFGEQVASRDGLAWLDVVSSDLEAAGYAIGALDLCSAGVGSPNIRQRLYFVADPDGESRSRGLRAGHEAKQRRSVAGDCCGSSRVADSDANRLCAATLAELHDAPHHAEPRKCAGELGVASGQRPQGRQDRRGNVHGPRRQAIERAGLHAGSLANASDGQLPQPWRRSPERDGLGPAGAVHSGVTRPGPTNGFWGVADWLFCRDGRWRAVEPGTSPLASGIAGRMGLLRGYGDAINAVLAETFLRTFRELKGWATVPYRQEGAAA